jgi:HSP20 family protein
MFGLQKQQTTETPAETSATKSATYLPAVDVTESESGYTIFADVPGANKDNVNVSYEDGIVTLSAAVARATTDGKAIHREFKLASYERAFKVGEDVDIEAIGAEISNGVLKVTLPRKASVKKNISVSAK